jgi:tetratricopeptide (TPR) repeat protein
LAGIHAQDGRTSDATAELARAIAIRRQDAGGDPRRLGRCLIAYAELKRSAGAAEDALTAYQAALAHWQAHGADDPATLAAVLNGLAASLARLQRYTEAEPLLAHALALLEHSEGPTHEALAVILANQSQLYACEEKWPQAIASGVRLLGILESHGGTDCRDYVTALNAVIAACAAGADYEQAIALNRRAIAIVERTLGAADPNLATTLQNCAVLLKQAGRPQEAVAMESRAAVILASTH